MFKSMVCHSHETLWPFYFRETVKVTVRIFHKEKPLFRGEAAYHNGMRIPWAGDRKLLSLLKQAAWQQTWTSCLSPWYDASCFLNYPNNWMMVLNA